MSEFHGGWFIPDLTADMQAPILDALRGYLQAESQPLDEMALCFATRKGCPVTHVAVRGGPADGKGYCFWHHEHMDAGKTMAKTIDQKLWGYCYENQSGWENVTRFTRKGKIAEVQDGAWDQVHADLGLGDSDGDHQRLMAQLPLGRLAAALGVPRSLLDMDLAYDTPSCSIPFAGQADPDALGAYLAGSLVPMPAVPTDDTRVSVKLYFQDEMAAEMGDLAERLGVSMGTIAWLVWEGAKPGLFEQQAGYDADGHDVTGMPSPPVVWPDGLALPAEAEAAEPLVFEGGKVSLGLDLPERLVEEIKALALFGDRSMSWGVQQAYLGCRDRLLALAG